MNEDLPRNLAHPRNDDHAMLASLIVGVSLLLILGGLIWFYLATTA